MARRTTHGSDGLRQAILETARSIIEESGLPGLSAREIAVRIGYSPGTLYNIFRNLGSFRRLCAAQPAHVEHAFFASDLAGKRRSARDACAHHRHREAAG